MYDSETDTRELSTKKGNLNISTTYCFNHDHSIRQNFVFYNPLYDIPNEKKYNCNRTGICPSKISFYVAPHLESSEIDVFILRNL